MANIFISYRRGDSQHIADRIYDHLSRDFDRKHLFKDVDNIPIGTNFRECLAEAVAKTDIMVAIIGPSWAAQGPDGRRRLDDPDDYVAFEVALALRLRRPVVPVLVEGARMLPREDLPEPLKELSLINAVPVRSDPDFANDYARLKKALKAISAHLPRRVTSVHWRIIAIASGGIALMAVAATMYVIQQRAHGPSLRESKIVTEPMAPPPQTTTNTSDTSQPDQPPPDKKNCHSYTFNDTTQMPPRFVKRWYCD